MNKKPLISIIVPVYNVEKYLSRCLDSILAQTFTDFEIVAVNDGSPDNCGMILDEYAQKDSRIKVIHKENGGVSSARNAGLDVAQGDYIGFVDADDYIRDDMYEKMLNHTKTKDYDIVICGYYEVRKDAVTGMAISEVDVPITSRAGMIGLIEGGTYEGYLWNKLYKRNIFDDVRFPAMVVMEDLYTNFLLFDKAKEILLLKETLYYYVRREDSVTMKRRVKTDITLFRYHMDIYDKLVQRFEETKTILNKNRVCSAFNALLSIDANKLQKEYSAVYEEAYMFLKSNLELLESDFIPGSTRKRIKLYLTNRRSFFVLNRLYNIIVHRKNTFECL